MGKLIDMVLVFGVFVVFVCRLVELDYIVLFDMIFVEFFKGEWL